MSFTFSTTVPAASNNPSNDQPTMLANNVSTAGIIAVDHIGFNTASGGGQHAQVYLNANLDGYIPLPPNPSSNDSIVFSNPGIASTNAQLYLTNSISTVQLSGIRAWGFCNSGGVIANQATNVQNVTRLAAGKYTVQLVSNSVTSSNFAVIVSATMANTLGPLSIVGGYVITGVGTFQLNFIALSFGGPFADPTNFSFQVLQI